MHGNGEQQRRKVELTLNAENGERRRRRGRRGSDFRSTKVQTQIKEWRSRRSRKRVESVDDDADNKKE
jgi:hypothetical protein